MKVVELLSEERIVPDLRSRAKPDVLAELASEFAARHPEIAEADVLRALAERENVGSTALEEGVAIPHGRSNAIGELRACLARSRRGVDFGSLDGGRTHFFFVLLVPTSGTGAHLKALARISALFQDANLRTALLRAGTALDLYRILAAADAAR